ncbi:MAG: hypothetical protein ACRDJM_07880, partial [Actinomycetota bacterium]
MRFGYTVKVGPEDLGRRVTVRSRTPDGRLSDTVGVLEECDDTTFGVRDKRGNLVRIERALVVAAKVIPQ